MFVGVCTESNPLAVGVVACEWIEEAKLELYGDTRESRLPIN